MTKRMLVVISGPSGVGKSTLLKKLFSLHGDKMSFSVSYTSRLPREGEVDGRDYYFVTAEEFKKKIEADFFVEWAVVHGNYYGTAKKEVARIIDAGKYCILDIDVQGAVQVRASGVEARFIFIAPKNMTVLRDRLAARGTETKESLEKRLNNAEKELTHKEKYDYIVVNDILEDAYLQLESYVMQIQ